MKKKIVKTTDWLTRGYSEEELAKMKEAALKEAEAELQKKQIEEMQKDIMENTAIYDSDVAQDVAETLVYKGYRKQSEGEWIDIVNGYCKCSNCETSFEALPTTFMFKENNIFCRHCGAKMKGGVE